MQQGISSVELRNRSETLAEENTGIIDDEGSVQ